MDGNGEYQKLCLIVASNGIHHRIACPYTHKQNGFVERKCRHFVEMSLALLAHSFAPFVYYPVLYKKA